MPAVSLLRRSASRYSSTHDIATEVDFPLFENGDYCATNPRRPSNFSHSAHERRLNNFSNLSDFIYRFASTSIYPSVTAAASKTLDSPLTVDCGTSISPGNYLILPPKHLAAANSGCISASLLRVTKRNVSLHPESISRTISSAHHAAAGSIEQSPTQTRFRISFYETVSFLILGKQHVCVARGGKVTIPVSLPVVLQPVPADELLVAGFGDSHSSRAPNNKISRHLPT